MIMFDKPTIFLDDGTPISLVVRKYRAQRLPSSMEEYDRVKNWLIRQGMQLWEDSKNVESSQLVVPSNILSSKSFHFPFVGYSLVMTNCCTCEIISASSSVWLSFMSYKDQPRRAVLAQAFEDLVKSASNIDGESITFSRVQRVMLAKEIGLQPNLDPVAKQAILDTKKKIQKVIKDSEVQWASLVQPSDWETEEPSESFMIL